MATFRITTGAIDERIDADDAQTAVYLACRAVADRDENFQPGRMACAHEVGVHDAGDGILVSTKEAISRLIDEGLVSRV